MITHTLLLDSADLTKFTMSDTYKTLLRFMIHTALAAHNEAFEHGDNATLQSVRHAILTAAPYITKNL